MGQHKTNLYAVGVYETPQQEILPTHVSPILAEKKHGKFRRIIYVIKIPYEIFVIEAIGKWVDSVEEMFPVKSYIFFAPKPFRHNSQVILISKSKIIVEKSKILLLIYLTISMLNNIRDMNYMKRSLRTIINVF
jgi:hypothetical protein